MLSHARKRNWEGVESESFKGFNKSVPLLKSLMGKIYNK